MLNATSLLKNVNPNHNLFSFLDKYKSISELKQFHALYITFGLPQDNPFTSKLLSFAATSNSYNIDYAYAIFRQLSYPTIFNWNTIIRGYSKCKNPIKSVSVFIEMLRDGVSPDHLTYPFLAKAAAHLPGIWLGLAVHCHILRNGYESDRFIKNSLIHMYGSSKDIMGARKLFDEMPTRNSVSWNSMIDGYAKCGSISLARDLFEVMPERDVVSWSSLIDGYVKDGQFWEALMIFERMQEEGPKVNEVTMVSVLCACAHIGSLEHGRKMHCYIAENELPLTLVLRTSLVDMYAKCGAIEDALAVFHGVPVKQTDVLIWNAVIGGLATHGFVMESLDMFTKMQIAGIKPDEITYLCLLSACAHGGLVKEAWYFFESLSKGGLNRKCEHFACMVDVMARAGQLTKAYIFMSKMPVEPSASMLGALLSGCISHRKLDLAEIVGKKLIELQPDHDGRYVGLSNAYAVIRRWDEARTMRETMERRGVKKSPGYSFVDIFGASYRFIAHDKTHPQSNEIYMMLNFIVKQMIIDVDSETEEPCYHDIEDV